MKKWIFIAVVIGVVLLVTVGCNNSDSLFTDVNLNNVNLKVKSSLSSYYGKNGIYLYQDGSDEMFLFLNAYNVMPGEKATYYTDIGIEVKDKMIVINFSEKFSDDYQNKEIENNRLLYKIKKPKNVETISILKNGQDVPFNSIVAEK
ncbi:MAG: hypothetical protein K0R54_2583 [Clostridiaceae bacterium]|jgi:hypothetical protein|nr:hypothetical protein [Clostridiaceae bacterium]